MQTIRVEATAEATSAAVKLPLTLRETPQSVTVISLERLDDQDLLSLQDVLDNYDNSHHGEPNAVSASLNWQFWPRDRRVGSSLAPF